MNITKTLCALAACGGTALAAVADEVAEAEKGEKEEASVVSAEVGLAFDSRYMTYGVVDGKDPILTPSAKLTFFDWVYGSVEAIFDVTKGNGKRGGYGNRAGKYTTLDGIVGVAHEFEINDDVGALSFDFNYIYEYIPRHHGSMDDTQYLNLELGLSEGSHWIAPTLAIERDLMADEGTYVNLELAHEFALVEGKEGEDPVLAFTPSVAQGFGNTSRTHGYFGETSNGFRHGGIMDTCLKGTLTWNIADGISLEGYVAYSDYWFDSNMRDAARAYNAEWGKGCDHSWNFYGGIALTVSF